MNYLDIFLAVPIVWGIYKGFKKGLIIELATLIAFGLGVLIAIKFSSSTKDLISSYIDTSERILSIIGFSITFLLVVIIVILIAKILEKFISLISLSIFNRIGGVIFAILKYALFNSVLILILNTFDPNSHIVSIQTKNESVLYKPIKKLAPLIIPTIKNNNLLEYYNIQEQIIEKEIKKIDI